MGRLSCSICKKKKPLLGLLNWHRCSKHGVICNSCKVGGLISDDKCPKCGNKLNIISS